MSALGSLVVKLSLDHAEYTKGLDRNSQEALKFAQRTQRTFDNAASNVKSFATRSIAQVGAFVGALAGINASLTSALAFDRQLAEVSTLLSGTTEEMQALRGESERLAREFGTLPTDQAKAFYQVISAGASTAAEATDILTAANRLAVGGVTDVLTAADGLTSILNAYGNQVESAAAVSDTLFVGMKAGKTTIAELSANMGKVAPLAASLNVGFDELVATIAALTKGGISTAESITGVRSILAAITKPTSEAKKLAGDLGIEFNAAGLQAKGFAGFLDDLRARTGGSVEQLSLLFGGVEALVPIMALSGQAGADFSAIMGQMGDKAGATEEAFNKMADSRGFKIDQLMSSINSIALTLGDTLANVLAPAASWAAEKLNELFGAQQEASAIEKKQAEIASLRKELAALNDKKNIPVIGDLIFDKRQSDLLSQRIEDGEDDLKRLTAAFEETAKEAQETEKPIQELTNSLGNLPPKTDSGAKSFKNLSKSMDVVDKDAAEAEREIRRLTLAYDPLIKRNEELSRVTQLVAAGLRSDIADQEYARIINDYMSATATAVDTTVTDVNAGLQRINDKSVDVFGSMEQFAIQGLRNIQTSVSDGLFRFFDDGLSGMLKSVKFAVGRIIAEFASIKLLQASGLSGLLGMGSTAAFASGGAASGGGIGALNLASLGSSAFNLAQGGFGLTGALGGGLQSLGGAIGSNSLFQFGAGVSGDLLAAGGGISGGLGASLGAIAGPAAIAFAGTQILKSLAGDKRVGGGFGKALNTIGDIPIIGDFLPIVPLINGLFGRGRPKFEKEDLVGTVSVGGFDGVLNQRFKEKGGLARSDRVSNFIADTDTGALLNQFGRLSESGNIPGSLRDSVTDPATKRALEVGQFLDEAFTGIGDTLKATAEKLGLSSDALNNFSAELDLVSEKGETLSEAQISDEIARISDEMAKTLIPNLDEFAKTGESATETVVRLGNQFAVLENAVSAIFGVSGQSAEDFVNQFSIPDQTAFLDAAGGIESFSQKINQFIDGLPDTDKLDILQTSLSEALSAVGVDFIPTMDQFREAMKSGELSAQQFLAGLDLQGALQQYEDLSNAVAEPLNNVIERIGAASQSAIDPADQLLSKLDALGLGALDTSQEIIDAIKTQGESAGLTETQFDGLIKAMDETSGGIESLIDAERQLAEERKRAEAADRRDFVAARRAGEMRDASAFAALNQRVIDIRIKDLQTAIDNIEKRKEAQRLLFLENPEEFLRIQNSPGTPEAMALLEQIRTMMQFDPRLQNFTSGFDVREEFERDGSWLNSFFGDAIQQMGNGSNFWEIISKRIVDHFKNVNLANGADGLNDLRKQFELGVGEFAPDPVDTANIERERIGLETQLLQLQGDTAALRQRELDALDESNRELLQRIFNLQDEQQRIAEAEQARAAIAQERAGLETQLMQLMGNTEVLRQRELEAIDGSNRGLLQRIFNLQDEQAEQQRLAAIAQERAGLETQLMQLQGDTAGLRQRELDALDESNRELLQRIFNLQDEQAEQQRLAAIAQERAGLETQLMQLQGDTAGLRQRELDALDESNRAILERIFALQDAAQLEQTLARERTENLNNAFAGLDASVSAERQRITNEYNAAVAKSAERIAAVADSVQRLSALSGQLKSAVESIMPPDQAAAKSIIRDAMADVQAGRELDFGQVGNAINALTNLSASGFSSSFEFERERRKNAALLSEFGGVTDNALTLEERTLSALNAQRERIEEGFKKESEQLDEIINQARAQVNALSGLDDSVLALADAIANFNAASQSAGGGGGEVAGGGGGLFADAGATDDPLQAARKIVRNITGTDYNLQGFGLQRENDILGQRVSFSKLGGLIRADFEAGVLTLLNEKREVIKQAVFDDLNELDNISQLNAISLAKKYDLPAFANGGFHSGGMRIVGERGPEIEFTGPSRIASNNDLQKLLNNEALIEEIEELILVVSNDRGANKKLSDKLNHVIRVDSSGLPYMRTGT